MFLWAGLLFLIHYSFIQPINQNKPEKKQTILMTKVVHTIPARRIAVNTHDTQKDKVKKARKNSEEIKQSKGNNQVSASNLRQKKCGKVSIIIDDMGRSIDIARKFLELPYPLAFAVLPYEPHAKEVAKMIKDKGRVLLLHMPMEPKGYPAVNPGPGALLLEQDKNQQKKLFLEALSRVPGAVGVNNHMGSKFTENREAMTNFLTWVKEQGLFFVDSMTTPNSVGCDVAKSLGVPCVKRDVFLDHLVKQKFILHQLKRLEVMAHNRCFTLAIGHPHELTYQALYATHFHQNHKIIFVSLLEGPSEFNQNKFEMLKLKAHNDCTKTNFNFRKGQSD